MPKICHEWLAHSLIQHVWQLAGYERYATTYENVSKISTDFFQFNCFYCCHCCKMMQTMFVSRILNGHERKKRQKTRKKMDRKSRAITEHAPNSHITVANATINFHLVVRPLGITLLFGSAIVCYLFVVSVAAAALSFSRSSLSLSVSLSFLSFFRMILKWQTAAIHRSRLCILLLFAK